MRRLALLVKAVFGDQDGVIVGDSPEILVEEPFGCLAERHAIRRVVATAFFELVDVGGVEGRLAIQRYHPVTGGGTGVIVSSVALLQVSLVAGVVAPTFRSAFVVLT